MLPPDIECRASFMNGANRRSNGCSRDESCQDRSMRLPRLRLRTLMIVIGGIGLWLGLTRAYPEANAWLILLAFSAGPSAYLARRGIVQMKVHGESLSFGDRIAFFFCTLLFTVPIILLFLI